MAQRSTSPSSSPADTVTVNVGTLSNVLAAALQQASVGAGTSSQSQAARTPRTSAAGDQHGPGPSGEFSGGATASQSRPSSCVVLPSFLKRKREQFDALKRSTKRTKSIQSWDRDIVCLPPQSTTKNICYPRGKYRAQLGAQGLIGKLRLVSTMTVEDVEREVRSVFTKVMGTKHNFPFVFLQPTGAGSRSLSVPAVSSSFEWTAQQVAKLGANKQTIYILAMEELDVETKEIDNASGSDSDEGSSRFCRNKDTQGKTSLVKKGESSRGEKEGKSCNQGTSASLYERYVDLVDLTSISSEDENLSAEHCELDTLPSAPISLGTTPKYQNAESEQPDLIKAKHIMQQHQQKYIIPPDDENYQRIHIRRSHLFGDAMRAFSKTTFNVSKMLKVVFIGEPCVDDGGPRREFFQLLMRDAFTKSGLFAGWPQHVVALHNVQAVATNMYYIVGKMIAVCLVQGGQPPVCFAPAVADFLIYDEVRCDPSISNIPNHSVQQALQKVLEANSSQDIQDLLEKEEFDFRFDCGYTKPTCQIELSNREELVKSIWLHYVFFMPHAELDQLRKGFRETLNMEVLVIVHPKEIRSFLVASAAFDISADYLLDSFVIQYSQQGDNKRTAEEAVIVNWNDYVMECNENTEVTVGDILHFFTGSTKLTTTGFTSTPMIHFTDELCLPRASTCDYSITFPRSFGHLDYCEFKAKVDMCIKDSFGFGQP